VESPTPIAFPIQGIHRPRHLDVKENVAENWKTFKQAWSNYAIVMNIHQQPETYQVALFLYCVGPEALNIFNGMSFHNAQEKEELENCVKKLDEFTISETNKTYECYVFNSQNQSLDETFDAYVAASRKSCLFCGGIHPFGKEKCPAWGQKSCQCGGRNHSASKCKKSGKCVNNISSTDSPSSSVEDNEDIDYMQTCAVEPSYNSRLPKEIFLKC